MRELRTRKVDKRDYRGFLRKAESFYSGMKHAGEEGDWNLACLNAVHCVISSVDAVTTFYLGERSAGQRHEDAAGLLRQTSLPNVSDKTRQVLDILAQKTMVEYDPTEPTENEARHLLKQAGRVHQWAKQAVSVGT
ncbi:MAG: HEPN domain-containing protein [Candidatus Micrarchaeota archaeon]